MQAEQGKLDTVRALDRYLDSTCERLTMRGLL
jgi:hypothetical protein